MENRLKELFGLITGDCCQLQTDSSRKSPRNFTDPESVISLHKVKVPPAKDKLSITGYFKHKSRHSKNQSFLQPSSYLPQQTHESKKSHANSSFWNCQQTPKTRCSSIKEPPQDTFKNLTSSAGQHKSTLTQTTVATKNYNSAMSEHKNNRVSIRILETQKEKQKKVSDPEKQNKQTQSERQQAKEGSVDTDMDDQFMTKFRLTESVYDDSYQSSQFSKRGSVVEFSLRQMPRMHFKTDFQLSSSGSQKINTVRTCSFKQPPTFSTSRENDTDKYSEVQYSLKVMPQIAERPAQMEESKFKKEAQSFDEVPDKFDS